MLADFPGFADISRNPPDRLPRSALLSQPVAEGGPQHRVALHIAHSGGLGIARLNGLIIYAVIFAYG
jgi:hypothetical protein